MMVPPNQFGEKLNGYYPLKRTSKKYLEGQIKVNGKIDLYGFYYDGAKKLATSSSGIAVTGAISAVNIS